MRFRFWTSAPPAPERIWWKLGLPDGQQFGVKGTEREISEAIRYSQVILIENEAGQRRIINCGQVLYAERTSEEQPAQPA